MTNDMEIEMKMMDDRHDKLDTNTKSTHAHARINCATIL